MVRSLDDIPAALVGMMRMARTGFLSLGATPTLPNRCTTALAVPAESRNPGDCNPRTVRGRQRGFGVRSPLSEVELAAMRATPQTWREHAAAGRGLAVVFVPISLLQALSFVELGGRGFLPLADLDTIFQDSAIASPLVVAWNRRRTIGTRMPFVLFCLISPVSPRSCLATS